MNNIKIAEAHRRNNKWVGYLIAEATRVALFLNTLVVPLGLIVGIWLVAPLSFVTWWMLIVPASLVVGSIIALLADVGTITNCARWRGNNEAIDHIRERYAVVPGEDKHADIAKMEEDEIAKQERARSWNQIGTFTTSGISFLAGELLWHTVCALILPGVWAIVASTGFSLLVSYTLISGTLAKRQNNDLIRESIVSDHFDNEAVAEDAQESIMQLMKDKCLSTVQEIGNSDVTQFAIEEYVIGALDRQLAGGKGQIPLRIEREKEDKRIAMEQDRERLATQLRLIKGGKSSSNDPGTGPLQISISGESTKERVMNARQQYPNASSRELAEMLNVSQTSVQYHIRRLNTSTQ